MRQKASLVLTLFAWLFATGSHWDLVQTFAWGKMFATYAQSMSYADAAKLTFTADNFCGICEIVQDATDAEESNAPAKAGTREIQLALGGHPAVIVPRPDTARWIPDQMNLPQLSGSAPPTPPPRA